MTDPLSITLTIGTPSTPHEVVGTISFLYSSRAGILSESALALFRQYRGASAGEAGELARTSTVDYAFLFEDRRSSRAFEQAFMLTTQELRRRAGLLGADAVIGMTHHVDLRASDADCLYVEVSGSAVRFLK